MAFSSFSELGQSLGMDIPPDTEPAIKTPHGGVPGEVTGRPAKPSFGGSNPPPASIYFDILDWPTSYYRFRNRRLGKWQKAKRCPYCDHAFIAGDRWWHATKDHVLPKSKGGRWIIWACFRCNKLKGSMTPREWGDFLDRTFIMGCLDPLAGKKQAYREIVHELLEHIKDLEIEVIVNELLP